MNLELHHFFILVKPEAYVADLLLPLGMLEGTRNKHEGQGTSNRRFNFTNGTLEFLWIHDSKEATKGPGRDMFLSERANDSEASPFGIILNRKDSSSLYMPFKGWTYQPGYFEPPWAFHIGENSNNLNEPLCIYMPFVEPNTSIRNVKQDVFKTISKVKVFTPSDSISDVLSYTNSADRLSIEKGNQHLIEITFDDEQCGFSKDFRPDIPLVIHW